VNACFSALQHLRPLRGGAQSHLLRASDGASYVTKFQNNPQHIRVPASEISHQPGTGARVADASGGSD
jgi:hypothetical protein